MRNTFKKIAIYDPYLDILGGGEKYILSIAKVFDELGFQVYLLWDKPRIEDEIKNRLNLSFSNIRIIPNFLIHKNFILKTIKTKEFDYFFYITNGSYFYSLARNNYVYAMVPNKKLYQMSFINQLKLNNFNFITHSKFTKYHIDNWTNKKSKLIYPFLDNDFINLGKERIKKDKIILTVGRFFRHLHAKRQDIVIKSFKKIQQKNHLFKDFKLYLVGGLQEEDKAFFNKLKLMAQDNKNIIFLPNVSYKTLIEYYKKAMFYWHAAGYEVNEDKNPELVEHMGIAPLEAMASGCVTFCHNSGGPKEVIKNGVTGFLYENLEGLIDKTAAIYQDENKKNKITANAKKYIQENFSYEIFKKRLKEVMI